MKITSKEDPFEEAPSLHRFTLLPFLCFQGLCCYFKYSAQGTDLRGRKCRPPWW